MRTLKSASAWVEAILPLILSIGIAVGLVLILIFK